MYDTSTPGVVVDKVTGLMWQQAVDSNSYTQTQAQVYCAELMLAGHCDWRLPTRIELVSIVDFTSLMPAIDSTSFPGVNGSPSWIFWASSPMAWNPSPSAWYVQFSDGSTRYGDPTDPGAVRCVR
jgi:hypothetical protein